MSLCVDACSKSAHEVPDVEVHFKLVPLREHDLHPRPAVLRAAISVHVHHFRRCLSCLPVAFHRASCHGVQSVSLGGSQHRDKDLAVFVSHICALGSCSCGGTGKFLCDLLGKIKGCSLHMHISVSGKCMDINRAEQKLFFREVHLENTAKDRCYFDLDLVQSPQNIPGVHG